MGDNRLFYAFVLLLIVMYIANKLSMYIRYKTSGKVIYQVQYKIDILYIIIWGIIGFLWWVPVLLDLFKGNSIEGYRLVQGLLWIILMLAVSFIEAIKPRITEGGIYAAGNFYRWKDVQDCYWVKNESDRLLVEVTRRKLFIRKPTALRWRIDTKEKLKVENLIKAYKLKK